MRDLRAEAKPALAGLAVALVVLFVTVAAAAAEAKGTVKGTVANGTAGGGSAAHLKLALLAYKGTTETGKQTTEADQEGGFVFEELETGPEYTYWIRTEYQGVEYFSQPVTFPPGTSEQTAQLQVFETTGSSDVVKLIGRHFLIGADENFVAVSEVLVLSNSSDRVYVGTREVQSGHKETLRLNVPEGAQEVKFESGLQESRVFPVEGGFADTRPVYPGETSRIHQYLIPARGGAASFSTNMLAPADKVSVVVPDTGIQVSAPNLPNGSNPTIEGKKYVMLTGEHLAAGTHLEFTLTNLPVAAQPTGQVGTLAFMLGGSVLAALLGAAFVLRGLRSRKTKEDEILPYRGDTPAEAQRDRLEVERKRLVITIADLDDQYEAARLEAKEYRRLRAQQKRRLEEIARRQRAVQSGGGR